MAGNSGNEWGNVVSDVRNDIVFENRNKIYGAYFIRREYTRTVLLALLITVSAALVIALVPKILQLFNNAIEDIAVNTDVTQIDLTPPPIDETAPPPPPPPPPPPVMETVKFVAPVVVDEPVIDEPPPPIQEVETQISTVTQEGNGDDDEIIIPDEGNGNAVVEEVKEEIFTFVEQMPGFPGGEEERLKFIQKNTKYPMMEKENGIEGTVYVSFIVDKQGNINDVKVMRGVSGGPGLEKEALRVVKMMPKWSAGKQNGKEVQVQFYMPMKFELR